MKSDMPVQPALEYSEVRDTGGPLQSLAVEGPVDVYVRRGAPQMTVYADREEDLRTLETTLVGPLSLVISLSSSHVGVTVIHGGGSVVIRGANINVGGSIHLSNGSVIGGGQCGRIAVALQFPWLPRVAVRGSGTITLLDLDQEHLEVSVEGSGDVYAEGAVRHLTARVAGSGDIHARRLRADQGHLSVGGSGDIEAFVVNDVQAHVRGSGDIVIHGNPARRNTQIRGSGDIEFC